MKVVTFQWRKPAVQIVLPIITSILRIVCILLADLCLSRPLGAVSDHSVAEGEHTPLVIV